MRSHRPSRGFTLTEMLVVIGIIVLLIGILIPVVGRVRTAGYEATSRSQIQSLITAIERYHQDHKAYPGPLHKDPATVDYDLGGVERTGTENLTLGLLGGAVQSGGAPPVTYSSAAVGAGPMSLNPARPKKFAAYLERIPAEMTNGPCAPDFIPGASDTDIPEFVDRFPDRKPVLYMRAKVGAPWTTTATTLGPSTDQYDPTELSRYGVNFADAAAVNAYFSHPSMPNTPKQKDRFILISPGKDRKYGTGDDITNFD